MIPFGLHRALYSLLQLLSLPQLFISAMTGLTNLGWYEIAYVVGGGMKNVNVYNVIPYVGGATGLISAVFLISNVRIRRFVLLLHLGFSILLGFLGLAVLGWRMVRHMEDPWRMVVAIAFLFFYGFWFFYFQRTKRFFLASGSQA
jgi:hypothetical protein